MIQLKDLKKLRQNIGLTQQELAKKSGVSQSLIAKIESGIIDPAYSKAVKIIETIENYSKEKEKKALDVMNKKIITIKSNDLIINAIKKMRQHSISQLPVVLDDKPLGIISESIILESLIDKKFEYVSDIMEEIPPIISKFTNLSVISKILTIYPMVLVSEKGKIIGIITRADVISSF
jgi:predicted transcriptional regulator